MVEWDETVSYVEDDGGHVTPIDGECWICKESTPATYLVGITGTLKQQCGHCTQIARRLCEDYADDKLTMSRAAEKLGLSVYQFKFDIWAPWEQRGTIRHEQQE
jgi:hypothetical protein